MRNLILLLTILLFGCHNRTFDRDQRQIIAKNAIRELVTNKSTFDVTGFKEDTLATYPGTAFTNPIRYTLNVAFKGSSGSRVSKTGEVIFTPDGQSVISTQLK